MPDKISLIIPVRDEEATIEGLLDSIRGQSRQPEEVVIADGGSRDRTVELVESYIKNGYPVKLVKSAHAYPGKARNFAIEASKYDLIAMTDAGIRLDSDWLKELMSVMESDENPDVVYGNYEPVTDTFFKECLAIVFVPAPREVNGKKMRSHFIASTLIRKKVWRSVGGFPDFRAAEDRIFMNRIKENGFRTGFAPSAKVYWDIPGSFKDVFKRFSLYSMHDIKAGRWKDWHRAVICMYFFGALLILAGILFSPLWFVLILFGLFLRSIKLIFERSAPGPFFKKFNPKKMIMVTILMLLIDAAMFWGIAKYVLEAGREYAA